MAQLELKGVSKQFGEVAVIRSIDLTVNHGEFCVFVGPSGCGKSTLLRMIAGLEECTSGSIKIESKDVTDEPPARRGIAMVFQSYALYPHMSVEENMGFGLKIAGTPKEVISEKVAEAAKTLQIAHLMRRRPKDLSGGQRQRVAIGRAIVRAPKLFLFDEPLSNLDAALRVEMRVELARMKAQLDTTVVYVTHDQVEAMTLADKIVVLRDGLVEQIGTPLDLYTRPANAFVAGFIGSPKMNFFPARLLNVEKGMARLALAEQSIVQAVCVPPVSGREVILGVRPEHLRVRRDGNGSVKAEVSVVERLGGETYFHVRVGATPAIARVEGDSSAAPGDQISLDFEPNAAHLFEACGTRLN